MTDFSGSIENTMAGDNIEGSQHDENVGPYSHSQRSCVAGSGKKKMKRKATADVILESDIGSSLDNVARAIIESAKILADKMTCPYYHNEKLFTSLQALDLSHEYLIECYDYLTEHKVPANKFLGIPQQFKKEMLTRIMISASVNM